MTEYVNNLTAMITSVELLDYVLECLQILIVFLDVFSMLLREDEILGCLPHCFGGLFTCLIIEVDGL